MKKTLLVVMVLALITLTGCSKIERDMKTTTSNWTGGLDRVVTVYTKDGKELAKYEGKIDIRPSKEGNDIMFDLNGKRTIISGATVIVQEK